MTGTFSNPDLKSPVPETLISDFHVGNMHTKNISGHWQEMKGCERAIPLSAVIFL